MSEHSALAKAICHDVVESNICELTEQHEKYLLVREKVDAILETYPEYDYRKLQKERNDDNYKINFLIREIETFKKEKRNC